MDTTTLQTSLATVKAQILIYEAALTALGVGGVQRYELDTGQSRQMVTRLDLDKLNKVLEALYNRCATMEVRLTGSGSAAARADW